MELQILCVILSTAKDLTYLSWLRLMDLRNPRSDCEVPRRLSRPEMTGRTKKTGRKIYSPPGLKLGVVTPKNFGAVNPALGLVPLFLR